MKTKLNSFKSYHQRKIGTYTMTSLKEKFKSKCSECYSVSYQLMTNFHESLTQFLDTC